MSYQLLITQQEYKCFLKEARTKLLIDYLYQELDCRKCVEKFPSSTCPKDVEAKVRLLNSYYSTRVKVKPMVDNILKIANKKDFQSRLINGDASLVTEMANSSRDNFSFATKYCALIAPNLYPIFDSLVWKFFCKLNELGFFDKQTNKKFKNIKECRSKAYSDYIEIYKEFMDKSGISQFANNYREVDAFIWSAIKIYLLIEKKSNHTKICPVKEWLKIQFPNLLTSILASAIWNIISQIKF